MSDPNKANSNGWTLLMEAVRTNNLAEVERLLKAGADVNAETKKEYLSVSTDLRPSASKHYKVSTDKNASTLTPLIVAVNLGRADAVKILLDNGADIYKADSKGWTAFNYLTYLETLDLGEEVKVDLSKIRDLLKQAVNKKLATALSAKEVADIKKALEAGADANLYMQGKAGEAGNTWLMAYAKLGNKEVVDLLLEHGADPTLKNKEGKTAFDFAQDEAIKQVLKRAVDKKLATALSAKEVADIKKALEAGADANLYMQGKAGEAGNTWLMAYAKLGNKEVVDLLLEHGADPTLKNKDGKTALDLARELLQKEADPAKKAQYEAIVASLEKAAGITTAQAEVKFPNKAPETTWEAWYAEGAQHWDEKVSQLIATLPPEEQKNPESNPTVKLYMEIKSHYAALHETEVKRNKETNKAEKKRLATQMLATIKKLNDSEVSAVVTKLSDAEKSNLVQASASLQEELKSLEREHKKPEDVNVNVPPVGPTIVDGPDGGHGTSQPGAGETGGTGMGTDKEKAKVALAEAKHDGSQEKKGFWERNQEWIWWVLGIIAAVTLAFFAFKKGGWLNKDKKSSSSSAVVNSNSNSNSNNNSNTGNDNTNTNAGGCNSDCICNNTNNNTDNSTGVDNTLQNSGKLYSAKEANDIIASNLTQLFTKEKEKRMKK